MRNLTHRKHRKAFCQATGKKKYRTREEAAHDLGLLYRTTPRNGIVLSAYRCKSCEEYHVGHTPRKIRSLYGLLVPSVAYPTVK
jgi:hypothetical protein